MDFSKIIKDISITKEKIFYKNREVFNLDDLVKNHNTNVLAYIINNYASNTCDYCDCPCSGSEPKLGPSFFAVDDEYFDVDPYECTDYLDVSDTDFVVAYNNDCYGYDTVIDPATFKARAEVMLSEYLKHIKKLAASNPEDLQLIKQLYSADTLNLINSIDFVANAKDISFSDNSVFYKSKEIVNIKDLVAKNTCEQLSFILNEDYAWYLKGTCHACNVVNDHEIAVDSWLFKVDPLKFTSHIDLKRIEFSDFDLESFNKKQFGYNAVIDKETFINNASEIIKSIFDNMYDNRDDPEELSSYLEYFEPVISKKISEIIKNENQNELTSKKSKGRGR